MSLPRCEKHDRPIFRGQTECFLCAQERQTPEEREEWRQRFRTIVAEVMPFAEELKARMIKLGKIDRRVLIACPNKNHYAVHYISARLNSRGSRDPHLHFACEDHNCHYRMME